LSIGGAAVPSVGWLPLAPGEIYRPAYVVSPTYIRNVNKTVIVNNTTINNVTVNKTVYVNRSAPNAITAVPVSVFAKGAPVTSVAKTVPPQLLHHDAAISAAPPVAPPSHPLVGVTQRVKPPPARHIFERPVVATPSTPGHRTVRAALAGREMPTVESRDKAKVPEGVTKMPPAVGQPVPVPSRNAAERLTVPPQGEHRIEHGNQSIRHESVPHPPRHAEEHPPVSRGVPIRPTVPHAEERLAPLSGAAPAAASLQVPQPHRSEAGDDRHHSAVQHVPEQHQEQGRPEGHEHAQGEHHGRWYGLEKGGHVQHAPI
jgi:hypothetical protein